MKNKNLVVQRVPDYYVFEEYAQIRIPFMSSIKIHDNSFFMASNMICSYNLKDKSVDIMNQYIDDDRKEKFPYSDIPLYASYEGFRKVYYVNQLLDLDKDYWGMVDYDFIKENIYGEKYCAGHIIHLYLIKDKEDILFVSEYYDLDVYDKNSNSIKGISKRKYTVEEIKYLMSINIKETNTPRINRLLNPNIDRGQIEESKKLIKKLRK